MTTYALLSDIHANLEALEAVLQDIEKRNVDEIIVLGDVIGHGPNPRECWKIVSEIAKFILVGYNEQQIISGVKLKDDMLIWTVKKLRLLDSWDAFVHMAQNNEEQQSMRIYNGKTFVHAAPSNTTKEHIWPGHIQYFILHNEQLDRRLKSFMDEFTTPHGFFGHTHVPTVLTHYENHNIFDGQWNKELTFLGPNSIFFVPQGNIRIENLEDKRIFINPGSIGQSKDKDQRACYTIYNEQSVEFIRVDYDVAAVQNKIAKINIDREMRNHLCDLLQNAY
ncbi:metallophosphoesterase family protein [Candidatus Uabimicrobium amorphum]|uniref:Phosphoesterase n=1 Tax=Uabimicrobium amorphum TaxID=2596890 RepID=A0A5S9F1Y5_UABAM|nr:metallophosphoesterase family protein [Candidatus Uabimicrobium amorphum]BBM81814.1 phosphoesterase [Candidatus Uabimicrobium amorphum]